MVLSRFEESYNKETRVLQARARAKTRIAIATAFIYATHSTSKGNTSKASLTKAQCMSLIEAVEAYSGSYGQAGACKDAFLKTRQFIFDMIDEDKSGTIELPEMPRLLLLVKCCQRLTETPLLAHKAEIATARMRLDEAQLTLRLNLPADIKHDLEPRVRAEIAVQAVALEKAEVDMQNFVDCLQTSFRILGKIDDKDFDFVLIFFLICHFWVMAAFEVLVSPDFALWASVGFNAFYFVMLVLRLHSAHPTGGHVGVMAVLNRFFDDPRGREYQLKNGMEFWTVSLGCTASIVTIIHEVSLFYSGPSLTTTGDNRVLQCAMLAPLFNIFVMSAPWRHIVRSLMSGIQSIRSFAILLILVMYVFCVLAFYQFSSLYILGSNVFSEEVNFSSLGMTCLTMFQIFIGAGW